MSLFPPCFLPLYYASPRQALCLQGSFLGISAHGDLAKGIEYDISHLGDASSI